MEVSSSVNEMALKQLDLAADRIGLDLKCAGQTQPARSCFDCEPTRMDNGTVRVFTGYRLQHNDALGPFKEASAIIPK